MSEGRAVQAALVIPEIVEMILITLAFVDFLRMEGICQVGKPPTSIQGKRDSWKSQRREPLR